MALTFSYDQLGNRWAQTATAGSAPQPSYNFSSKNQITGYTYDAAGNQTYDGTYYYTYDAENRLIKVGTSTMSPANVATYSYDALGRRVTNWTSAGGSWEFLFDLQGHPVTQVAPNQGGVNLAEVYVGGRHWVTDRVDLGEAMFMHTDWLGTGRVWTTPSGTVYSSCVNLPFGDFASCGPGYASNSHFTGQEYNGEDNLTHFPFRMYSMTQGRWMHTDPAGLAAVDVTNPQTWNRYAYVTNNPLSYTDPLGLFLDACNLYYADCTGGEGGGGGGGGDCDITENPLCNPLGDGGGAPPPIIPVWGGPPPEGGGTPSGLAKWTSGETLGLPQGLNLRPMSLGGLLGLDPSGTCDFGVCNPVGQGFGPGVPFPDVVGWGVRLGSWLDAAAGLLPGILLSQVGDADPPHDINCDAQEQDDLATCKRVPIANGARGRCYDSVTTRRFACDNGRPLPPLIQW